MGIDILHNILLTVGVAMSTFTTALEVRLLHNRRMLMKQAVLFAHVITIVALLYMIVYWTLTIFDLTPHSPAGLAIILPAYIGLITSRMIQTLLEM